jgi:mono/diheme cytochrome c family protein
VRQRILAILGLVLPWPVAGVAEDLVPLHHDLAARTFDAACASCHYRGAERAPFGSRGPPAEDSPDELVQYIMFGVAREVDEGGMPAFGPGLTDADVTRLVIWLRSTAKPDDPWSDVAARVAQMRTIDARED